jgi:hypothetical protein
MIARQDGEASEKVDEIERVVQSLMDQSPALGAAFDRVNSFSSGMSQLSLNTSDHGSDNEGLRSKRPPQLLRRPSPLAQDLERTRSSSNLSTVSSSSRPGTRSGSEAASSEPWAESSCSSVEPSPVFRKSPMLSFKAASNRRVNLARSLPPLPPPLPISLPPIPPLPLRRSASDDQSIRLPPAMWDDNATIRDNGSYSQFPMISETDSAKLKRSASTMSQQASFEKELFKNSAIYCDLLVSRTFLSRHHS